MAYGTTLELAHRAAVWCNENDPGADASRPTTKYLVEKYADPNGRYSDRDGRFNWGVVRKWRYADRPDLAEFGGAFVNLTEEMWG